MKKKSICLLMILFSIASYCQQGLKQSTIKDFAAVCWFNYSYGNQMFVSTMNTYMGYERSKVALIMENLESNKEGREKVFDVFYRLSSGNYESLFNNLYGLKLTATAADEIAKYIIAKNNPQKRNEFFTGTKRFSDGKAWDYEVVIKENNIILKLYPNIKNTYHKNKKTPTRVTYGVIRQGKIITKDSEFKLEYGVLYEMNNEGGWNSYNEVKTRN